MTDTDRRRPEQAPDTPETELDLGRLASDLRLACMRISRRVRFESTDAGMAPHQFSALVRLEDGPMTPGRLAEIENVAAPSMTRTVAGLVEAGWVVRRADPGDRRAVLVELTDLGRDTITGTRARRDLWFASRLAQLPAADVAALAQAAGALAKVAAL